LSNKGLELQERDIDILRLAYRFRFCLGRHVRVLCGFRGARASDRRLKLLVEAGYLERKKILYGIPYLYMLTHKGRLLIGANKRAETLRIERIVHDIHVLDSVIYFLDKAHISLSDIISEKELHVKDGFGSRRHYPDFLFNAASRVYAVEIETALKSKERLEKIIRSNYLEFDGQYWIVGENPKIKELINAFAREYSNIRVIDLKDVLDNGSH